MIPETNGTLASFRTPGGRYRIAVAAWDADGFALVPGNGGRLCRAVDEEGFDGLCPREGFDTPTLTFGAAS